ncbi:clathrin coat assembly protein AP180 [Punica granatum]|uniref:Clathrin coat assembly protein AP180 n=1 Tax=Punica granatum TaxID=22663 RepID=A0A6P8CAP4_PUNGR|nr:clathrin coat assembly protein AP180 [Punica granatum]
MPSKLKKAIGAVKDQTSISLAKVGSNNAASNLEVAILKATSHDEAPMDERYVTEILQLVASNKVYAATCAQVISRRVGKTKNWTVALKSLMLVLRIFQDGDPYFPREVLHTMKRGGRILNLSTFRDRSKTTNPWDYTAYVRTFALYLEERLDCFLMGKLQRRVASRKRDSGELLNRKGNEPIIGDMKPAMLLDRISYWQPLLDRAIATRPTGAAKTNGLVQISLHAIVQESFDLYRDTSDGLALLLDSFFHLQYQSCVNAFQTCVKASQQFEELSEYYALCKSMGVGRTSEYPSVQKISEELVETLREFLKDQSAFPNNGRSPSPHMLLPSPPLSKDLRLKSEQFGSERMERFSEKGSEPGSQCASLEDLFSVTDGSTSPSPSPSLSLSPSRSPSTLINEQEQPSEEMFDKQSQQNDGDNFSSHSSSLHQGTDPTLDFVLFDEWPSAELNRHQYRQQGPGPSSVEAPTECWELALAEIVNQAQPNAPISGSLVSTSGVDNLFDNEKAPVAHPRNNPFLDDEMPASTGLELVSIPSITATSTSQQSFFQSEDIFSVAPSFQAMSITPTFNSQNLHEDPPPTFRATSITPTFNVQSPMEDQNDPFSSNFNPTAVKQTTSMFDASTNHQNLQLEQQLWLQQQNKIISKHMA